MLFFFGEREIQNMSKLKDHINVLKLDEVLELVQDTKSTIFLILELAAGGELFDRYDPDSQMDCPLCSLRISHV
jgi:serine/threonine protein kinase